MGMGTILWSTKIVGFPRAAQSAPVEILHGEIIPRRNPPLLPRLFPVLTEVYPPPVWSFDATKSSLKFYIHLPTLGTLYSQIK